MPEEQWSLPFGIQRIPSLAERRSLEAENKRRGNDVMLKVMYVDWYDVVS